MRLIVPVSAILSLYACSEGPSELNLRKAASVPADIGSGPQQSADSSNEKDVNQILETLYSVLSGNQKTDEQIELLKNLIKDLEQKLTTEISERKAADLALQGRIDDINGRLAKIDEAILELANRDSDFAGLTDELRRELDAQKIEYQTLKNDLTAAKLAINDEQRRLGEQLDALRQTVESNKALSDKEIAAIKAEIQTKETQYQNLLTEFQNQKTDTTAALNSIRNDLVGKAMALERKFTDGLNAMAVENARIIGQVYAGMDALANRLSSVEGDVAKLEIGLDALGETVQAVQTAVGNLANETTENRNRIIALEQFKKISQFCAAAAASLTVIEKELVALISANRSLYGPSTHGTFRSSIFIKSLATRPLLLSSTTAWLWARLRQPLQVK